jgi:hypothetical protein
MSQVSENEDDLAFERLLLAAGRAEALPQEQTEVALLRFAAGLSALQGVVGSTGSGEPAISGSTGSWARLVTAAKWVGLGIIAGGGAIFGWLQHETRSVEERAPAAAPIADVQPKVTSLMPPASPEKESPVPPSVPPQGGSARAEHVARAPSVSGQPLPSAAAARSGLDLAAEVAALDGIRTALSIGAWRDAEKQTQAYRRAFPRGALRSEAEVLAIEGLMAQGRRQAAITAGERFISSHPRDPQVSRVRALIE